ncbi:hypothetical protein [Pseudoprimorskyibacter insulae]|uniref:Uncharacterized protein n=1 Tax=Pseudoprimorskyibacter insulae TaxID=1695997 RepID=A0A2R8APH6_9RHOB|nr:hypothetical protein [Pseudoprimorskyibacter insulae]SPF77915.1 hypothetical protein PRI8871_00502 [Pseudoprimorskyibacter insulae]
MRRRITAISLGIAGLFAITACAVPGHHHLIAPGLSGLGEIAPNVWTDDPQTAEAQLALLAQGQALAETLFDDVVPGSIVLCTQSPCAKQFNLYVPGLAFEDRLIAFAPDGVTLPVITHEFVHVGLQRRIGPAPIRSGRIPAWFNEGLAVWVSPDPRYIRPASEPQALWVTAAQTPKDWKAMAGPDSFAALYGAAGRMVEAIAEDIGRDGLLALVDAVASGAAFDAELARLRGDT